VEAHEAAGVAEDEVVEKLDAEELAGGGETPRKGDVLGARLGITAYGDIPINRVMRNSGLCGVRH